VAPSTTPTRHVRCQSSSGPSTAPTPQGVCTAWRLRLPATTSLREGSSRVPLTQKQTDSSRAQRTTASRAPSPPMTRTGPTPQLSRWTSSPTQRAAAQRRMLAAHGVRTKLAWQRSISPPESLCATPRSPAIQHCPPPILTLPLPACRPLACLPSGLLPPCRCRPLACLPSGLLPPCRCRPLASLPALRPPCSHPASRHPASRLKPPSG